MRRRLGALLVLVAVLVAPGCDDGDSSEPATTAEPPVTQTEPVTTPEVRTAVVRIYAVRGESVGPVARSVDDTAALSGALLALLGGLTDEEAEWGLSTAIPAGVSLLGVTIADGTATVDLSGTFDDGGGSAGMFLRLAQLVHTATQFPNVQRVALRLDGEPVSVFSSEGIELPATLTRADVEDQAPAILVESPLPGERVTSPLHIAGTANTFEATLEWELVDGAGVKLASGFDTATCGTGCRGTFEVTETFDATGPATLRVFERSAKDGSETKVVEIPLELG